MFIAGLGLAAPTRAYSQFECWESLQNSPAWQVLESRSRAILKKVLTARNGITTRHLALENLADAFDLTPDALHARFRQHAPALATTAAERAIADAGVKAEEIDAVLVSTCTGYLCPGLTSYVAEQLGLRADVLTLDLVGQGCGAALPNLRAGEALIMSGRSHRVLSICVEVCSAAFYLDNDPGVLISACLFGDGAGASVLSESPGPNQRIEWLWAGTLLRPDQRNLLCFDQNGGMLRNVLTQHVPELAGKHARSLLDRTLVDTDVKRNDIKAWILHPGGRDVLLSLKNNLELSDADLTWSATVLNDFGNVSSASVYFVLAEALKQGAPQGCWWMSSFGAGFSCHGALLRVA